MKFEIPLSTLRAARFCTAKADVRYYLMGVHVDLARGKVEATTGHIALILAGPRDAAGGQCIIPNAAIDALFKAVGKRASGAVTVTVDTGKVTLEHGHATASAAAIDGTFPDCTRVVPERVSGEAAQYNPEYMVTLSEAICAYRNKPGKLDAGHHLNVRLEHNGASPAVMHDGDVGVIGLVMPLRSDALPAGVLEDRLAWARART